MKTRSLTRTALMAVTTFVAGLIRLPLGPVPFTLQTLLVLLTGLLLKPSEAFSALLLHLALKLAFYGLGDLLSPSFGFVIAFIPAAWLLALLTSRRGRMTGWAYLDTALASLVIYLIGIPYLALILHYLGAFSSLGWGGLLQGSFLIFLPGDLFKALLAIFLAGRIRPLLEQEKIRLQP